MKSERALLLEILAHLREIERRRLFSDLGYSSLFTYCTERLGYSADAAYRRIQAMRLAKNVAGVDEKLASDALSLTNASQAQSFFRKSKLELSEQNTLLARLENKSTREAAKIIAQQLPEPVVPDKDRELGYDLVEFKFLGPSELREQLQKLRGLLAHKSPYLSMAELLMMLTELGMREWDPARKPPIRNKARPLCAPKVKMRGRPSIPASVRREVWRRNDSACQNCRSTHGLEIDHIIAVALGGGNELANLRLLCRRCNQRHAIRTFGIEKMQRHFEET